LHESLAANTDMAGPSRRPRVSVPATYRSGTETNPAVRGTVARWHAHLRGLATEIHEISGLAVGHRSVSFLGYNPPHNLEIQLITYSKDKGRVGTLVALRRITLVLVV
jgi:hypothetical protein